MRVERLYTKDNTPPFDSITFKRLDIEICHSDPRQSFCVTDFEVPASWSYAASEFLVRHFVCRNGVASALKPLGEEGVPKWLHRHVVDKDRLLTKPQEEHYISETSAKQIFHRMAGAWTYWGWTLGYFDTEDDARAFYDETCYMLAAQIAAPASPQWLNTGLHWAYGIEGESQGHFYVDAESGKIMKSSNAYERPLHHHSFIQGINAKEPESMMNLMEREAKIFLYGSGTGCNMSTILSHKEKVPADASDVGLMRFLSIGDKSASVAPQRVKADKLVMVDVDHPDIEQFICWKVEEEHKAASMIAGARQMRKQLSRIIEAIRQCDEEEACDPQHNERLRHAIRQARRAAIPESYIARILDYARQGITDIVFPVYGIGGESDVFMSVGAHHAKLAVRIPDNFMVAAEDETQWSLLSRTEKNQVDVVEADELLDQLAQAGWATGEPSAQFEDAIQFWHGCQADGRIEASSPQGEFQFLNNTACDVASLNLLHFVDDAGEFKVSSFEHSSRLMTIMLDIAISMAQFPSREIARNTYRYRPIGLSHCNLAAMIMRMGYAYDSDESRAIASAVTAVMTGTGYIVSAEMAKELGAFEAFSSNREGMMRLLHSHHEAAHGRTQHLGSLHVQPFVLDQASIPDNQLGEAVHRIWDYALIMGDEFGYSNAQISAIAMAPNAAKLLDADTISIMPEYGVVKYAMQAQGKFRKYVPKHVTESLVRLGYGADQIIDITRYIKGSGTLLEAPHINHESLGELGFGEEEIERIEEALPHAMSIQAAFDPYMIGEQFCRNVLNLDDAQMYDANFDVLAHLGFDAEAIDEASRHVCGSMCMIGAPHLRIEDLAVYHGQAAENKLQPFVPVKSQIRMMAAMQPFVSGGIAHRISVANDTSIQDYRTWIADAWKSGLKSISLYRIGCGLHERMHYLVDDEADDHGTEFVVTSPRILAVKMVEAMASEAANDDPGNRQELPLRRGGYTQKATIGGQTIYLRTGEYQDGRLGEIFVDAPKQTAKFRSLMNQFAIAVSIGLQYGVPLESFVDAFRGSQFEPCGHVEGNPAIDTASSVLDYIFRELSLSYLQNEIDEVPVHDDVASNVLAWNQETVTAASDFDESAEEEVKDEEDDNEIIEL